jgi:hypothetical protein
MTAHETGSRPRNARRRLEQRPSRRTPGLAALLQSPPSPQRHRWTTPDQQAEQPAWASQLAELACRRTLVDAGSARPNPFRVGNYEAAAWLLQRLEQRKDVDDPAVIVGRAQAHAILALIDMLGGAGDVDADQVEPAVEPSSPGSSYDGLRGGDPPYA